MQWLLKTLNWPCFSTLIKAERLGQELKEKHVRNKGRKLYEYEILYGMISDERHGWRCRHPYRCEIGNGDWKLKINDTLSNGTINMRNIPTLKDWYFDRTNFKIRTEPGKNACKLIHKILENLFENQIEQVGKFHYHISKLRKLLVDFNLVTDQWSDFPKFRFSF